MNLYNEKMLTSSDTRLVVKYFSAAFARFTTLSAASTEYQRFLPAVKLIMLMRLAFY
jgi:hypothetical protein